MSAKDTYQNIYVSQDKKNLSWILSSSDRKGFITSVYQKLTPPIRVLDIGCGKGLNSTWIGRIEGNEWIGIDIVALEISGLEVPLHGNFICGDWSSQEVASHPDLQQAFDLIIDQGGVLTSLTSSDVIATYLQRVSALLKPDGRFCALVTYDPMAAHAYSDDLPDKRHRRFFVLQDFFDDPFRSLFSLESKSIITYENDSPSNPYSVVAGNTRDLSIIQLDFRKK